MSNIKLRIISSLIMGLIFISSIIFIRPLFYILMYGIAAIMLLEWYKMTVRSKFYILLGLVIIPIPIVALLLISNYDNQGWVLLTYFCIIWTVDTMAMAGGKLIKGQKLTPVLSPNKTISGFVVGVTSAALIPHLLKLLPNYHLFPLINTSPLALTTMCAILAIFAQLSDLSISFFKRKFNIKDTGTIIPGHGGMLDRFDSIILTAPILVLYLHSYSL